MKKVWFITQIGLAGTLLAITIVLFSNRTTYVGKHRFKINQLVYSRFYEDRIYLIMDTLRDDEGRPAYKIFDQEDIMLDVEFSYTLNKTTNY